MKEHVDTITDLLLGAAYSDKRLEGDEIASISQLLCKLLGTSTLPDAQTQRIGAFNPAKTTPPCSHRTFSRYSLYLASALWRARASLRCPSERSPWKNSARSLSSRSIGSNALVFIDPQSLHSLSPGR